MFPFRIVILASMLLMSAAHASAHSQRVSAGDATGLPIPSLSHGEMAVLAPYRSEIMTLAGQINRTDLTFRRLQNYASIQYSYCLWGVAPGAISDEASPFNECAHAYLAAAKALLLYMRNMPGEGFAASELTSTIDMEMIKKDAAFIGCQYSAESFNTAEFVTPHWENLPSHLPSLACVGGALLLLLMSPLAKAAIVSGSHPKAKAS